MNAYILALSCTVPEGSFSQIDVAKTFDVSLKNSPSHSKKLHAIFQNSKIEKRHSVIADYGNSELAGSFFGENFPNIIPDTHKRNVIYKEEAPKLSIKVAKKVLSNWGFSSDKITHIISVSCTGMYAPGIEFALIEGLQLNNNVERFAINFMGCFGAFKGLSLAKYLAKENPKNRILVVCTELCSLHFQKEQTIENFVANALFADGAAAFIVGCLPKNDELPLFEIEKNSSYALKNSESLMGWEITNTGMQMKLSSKVPKIISEHIVPFAEQLLGSKPFSECEWAIHPGGKAILEAIETVCSLSKEQTTSSWKVLNDFGNMSSATFPFVLDEILKKDCFESIIGLGFGPGLSMEGILLKRSHAKKI